MYVRFAGEIDKKTPKHNLPDALFLYVGQPINTREESNIPYLSVFPICSVLPLKGRLYSTFLQQHKLILISSDVTAHARAFCGTRAHILPSFFGKVVRAAISEL